jgi:hypothetical protein
LGVLVLLLAPAQDHNGVAVLSKIDAVTGPNMNTKLVNAFAHRATVSEVSLLNAIKAH